MHQRVIFVSLAHFVQGSLKNLEIILILQMFYYFVTFHDNKASSQKRNNILNLSTITREHEKFMYDNDVCLN